MSRKKVLLAGESWVSTATHIKGFDQFPTVTYHQGADELLDALKDSAYDISFMPAHQAQKDFPQTMEASTNMRRSSSRISARTRCFCTLTLGFTPRSRPTA